MPPSKRVICVGHAALDRIYRIQAFPREPTKVRAFEHIETGGGMAANAAVAASRLGARVELWSRVGDDNAGSLIRSGLKAEKVDVRYVHAFEEARSSTSAVIVDGKGERLVVGMRDVAIPSGTSWLPIERITDADVVLGDVRWLEALRVVFAHARQAGIPTILDADVGAREALPDVLKLTDYAIFSAGALRELTHAGTDAAGLEIVLGWGAGYAGVTLGAGGYRWAERGKSGGHLPSFEVDVVDTTGAGDAFHGAFAVMVAERRPTLDCARAAAAVAAMKCRRLGSRAGLPTRLELEAFLATKA